MSLYMFRTLLCPSSGAFHHCTCSLWLPCDFVLVASSSTVHRINHHLWETLYPPKAFPLSICYGEYIHKHECNCGFHSSPPSSVSRRKAYMDTLGIPTLRSDGDEKTVPYLTKMSTANIFL
jgi:hypothetical protein